jgi:hypothetical protein
MTQDGWFDNYDWSYLFPNTFVEADIEYNCDEYDVCWYFVESTQEVCTYEDECFTPEAALEEYFAGEWDMEFDWDNWESEFDMTIDGWFDEYDWSYLFPITFVEGDIEYNCDEYDVCWYFVEDLREVCTYEGECFTPEAALEEYFSGEWDMEYDECTETHDEREGET